MLGLNSEIIVGIALILLCILFLYASIANTPVRVYWAALISYGIDYALIALGAGFIAHGLWTKRNSQKMRTEQPHH
jgi:hypothetical protein